MKQKSYMDSKGYILELPVRCNYAYVFVTSEKEEIDDELCKNILASMCWQVTSKNINTVKNNITKGVWSIVENDFGEHVQYSGIYKGKEYHGACMIERCLFIDL